MEGRCEAIYTTATFKADANTMPTQDIAWDEDRGGPRDPLNLISFPDGGQFHQSTKKILEWKPCGPHDQGRVVLPSVHVERLFRKAPVNDPKKLNPLKVMTRCLDIQGYMADALDLLVDEGLLTEFDEHGDEQDRVFETIAGRTGRTGAGSLHVYQAHNVWIRAAQCGLRQRPRPGRLYLQNYEGEARVHRLIAISTVDIQQHNKLLAFGPSSHEDAQATHAAARIMKAFLDKLVKGIKNSSLPDVWHPNVKEAVFKEYTFRVSKAQRTEYAPDTFLGDCANALGNGFSYAMPSLTVVKSCYTHIWRAASNNLKKLNDSSDARVAMFFTDLAFISEVVDRDLRTWSIHFFKEKWLKLNEQAFVEYLDETFFGRLFSRCDGHAGQARSTNALERLNRHLKSENNFDSVEGAGTVLTRACVVGHRLSRDAPALELVPKPSTLDWKKAQRLVSGGWVNLGFKWKDAYVFPSEKLLEDHLPSDADTIEAKRTFIKTWAKEYTGLMKNPTGYQKLKDGSWDFDILNDMMFSFWCLRPVPTGHPQRDALAAVGIPYLCTCPRFMHYHVCKHSIAYGLHTKMCKVPLRFDETNVGKRKAPAGASLTKRSRCLQVDD